MVFIKASSFFHLFKFRHGEAKSRLHTVFIVSLGALGKAEVQEDDNL